MLSTRIILLRGISKGILDQDNEMFFPKTVTNKHQYESFKLLVVVGSKIKATAEICRFRRYLPISLARSLARIAIIILYEVDYKKLP